MSMLYKSMEALMDSLKYWECEYENLLLLIYSTMPHDENQFVLMNSYFFNNVLGDVNPYSSKPYDEEKYSELSETKETRHKQWEFIKDKMSNLPHIELHFNPIDTLRLRFDLNCVQVQILKLLFLINRFNSLDIYCSDIPELRRLELLKLYCQTDNYDFIIELKSEGFLTKMGLAKFSSHPFRLEIRRHRIMIAISDYIASFLDSSADKPLSSFFLEESSSSDITINDYDFPPETIITAKSIINKNKAGYILLYGDPGTGKTEFSKILPVLCNKKSFFLKRNPLKNTAYIETLITALNLLNINEEVLIVDEADNLLNSEMEICVEGSNGGNSTSILSKEIINQLLDDFDGKIIFITNKISDISASVLRRLHLHIEFKSISVKQRKKIWEKVFNTQTVFSENDLKQFSVLYRTNPARIRQIADICLSMNEQGLDHNHIISSTHDMLKRGELIFTGEPAGTHKIEETYNCSFLNTSMEAEELLKYLKSWWNNYKEKSTGVNVLFYGFPGTGKSAFARYLSSELGIIPIVKKASDLISPWVGMTEMNIRDSFNEAEGNMLILDEADSLIIDRQTANRSWERSQTNELLTNMENFSGLLVATTNFTKALDFASFRRFAFKIEFFPPNKIQRLEMIKSYFPEVCFTDKDCTEFDKLHDLTPGDLNTVKTRFRFSELVNAQQVIKELNNELDSRNLYTRQIGF